MMVLFIWNPLSQKSPEPSKKDSNDDFYRAVKDEFPQWRTGTEGDAHEYSEAADCHNVISSAGSDDESGNTLLYTIATARQAHQGGNNHRGGHRCQYEAKHEADSPGQVQEEVGEYCHRHGLSEAGDEGCPHHHTAQPRQLDGIQLQSSHQQDDRQADLSESSGDDGIQIVANVTFMTVTVVPSFFWFIMFMCSYTSDDAVQNKLLRLKDSFHNFIIRNRTFSE